MLKIIGLSLLILAGVLIGISLISKGINKNAAERTAFDLAVFIKKGLSQTPFQDFTGLELVALGVLCLLSVILICWLYFMVL
ncbi:MAG: hypothetical protein ABSE08_13860 [Syntrophobacteraceae bacterium]|jgi:hypothetical protein